MFGIGREEVGNGFFSFVLQEVWDGLSSTPVSVPFPSLSLSQALSPSPTPSSVSLPSFWPFLSVSFSSPHPHCCPILIPSPSPSSPHPCPILIPDRSPFPFPCLFPSLPLSPPLIPILDYLYPDFNLFTNPSLCPVPMPTPVPIPSLPARAARGHGQSPAGLRLAGAQQPLISLKASR